MVVRRTLAEGIVDEVRWWVMEAEILTWLMRGLITATIGGLAGLFAWQRKISAEVAVIQSKLSDNNASMDDLTNLKLCMSETYIRREDYIPQMSLVGQKLDANAVLLARVDERMTAIAQRINPNG